MKRLDAAGAGASEDWPSRPLSSAGWAAPRSPGCCTTTAVIPRLPRVEALAAYTSLSSTRVLDRNGLLVGEVGAARHTPVPFEQISPALVQAALAGEPAFLQGGGPDWRGLARAVIASFRGFAARSIARPASPTPPPAGRSPPPSASFKRRMQEVVLVWQLSRQLPRPKIVELALNYGHYGGLRFGCEAAARYYFGVPARQLTAGRPRCWWRCCRRRRRSIRASSRTWCASRGARSCRAMARSGALDRRPGPPAVHRTAGLRPRTAWRAEPMRPRWSTPITRRLVASPRPREAGHPGSGGANDPRPAAADRGLGDRRPAAGSRWTAPRPEQPPGGWPAPRWPESAPS